MGKKVNKTMRKQKYVLFSPLGMTDPISNYHDGAMLHIARVYRPHRIYLYMSGEVSVLSDRDDRYLSAIARLGERIGQPFSIDVIKRPELSDVHLFDEFYGDFESEIRRVREENPDSMILLNVSSGTPAMKSALNTIAAMSDDGGCVPIQVSTPEKKHNPRRDDVASYDLDAEWDCNEDNATDFQDRTYCSDNYNLVQKLKKEIIRKHIDAFDYRAALTVAEETGCSLPEKAVTYLRAAYARAQLDAPTVDRLIKTGDARQLFVPVMGSDLRNIAEYLILLDAELKKHEYRSFIRGISPIFLDLLEKLLEKNGIKIKDYCTQKDQKIKLRREKLEKCMQGRQMLSVLDNVFSLYGGYRDSDLSSVQLVPLALSLLQTGNDVKNNIEELRSCEEKCRNVAAHEIISVTEEWVYKKCGIKPDKILSALLCLASHAGIPVERLNGSYEAMNELIKEALLEGGLIPCGK